MLLDVGTKPSESSLYHFWKTFHENPHAGGVCGQVFADLEYDSDKSFNILMAAQVHTILLSAFMSKVRNRHRTLNTK